MAQIDSRALRHASGQPTPDPSLLRPTPPSRPSPVAPCNFQRRRPATPNPPPAVPPAGRGQGQTGRVRHLRPTPQALLLRDAPHLRTRHASSLNVQPVGREPRTDPLRTSEPTEARPSVASRETTPLHPDPALQNPSATPPRPRPCHGVLARPMVLSSVAGGEASNPSTSTSLQCRHITYHSL